MGRYTFTGTDAGDATSVAYVLRRFVPQARDIPLATRHLLRAGDRADKHRSKLPGRRAPQLAHRRRKPRDGHARIHRDARHAHLDSAAAGRGRGLRRTCWAASSFRC